MKKVLIGLFTFIALSLLSSNDVFALDHNLTITKSDSSPASLGTDYEWNENVLVIKENDLVVTGSTESESIILSVDVTRFTIKDINIDISSLTNTAIEALNQNDIVSITVSGTNNISTGEADETEINGLKAPKLKLLGDGKLYIRGGHTHYLHRAIYVKSYFETSVSFLYLNAYNGIWVDEDDGAGGSIKINSGDVYVLTDNDGIISTYYESNMIIDDANVTIYSGLSGILVGNLTLNNDSQLIIQIEDYNGANNNNTIYTKHKLTLSDDASMYLTHCGGGYTNVHFAEGVVLPAGKKLKGCFRALGRPEECTDIEEDISSEFYMDWENIQYTVVYGNPTRLQAESIDFKTKILSEDSIEISGLVAPNISLNGLPNGRWYYLTEVEYYEGQQLSCLEEPYCLAADYYGGCRYHRMGYIAEGHAAVMPSLQPLDVNNGKATLTGMDFVTYPYIAIVYAIEDTIMCPRSENLAYLSYGVGLAEILDTTVGTENNDANILKVDNTGKIRDRIPAYWCGEWELDNIYSEHKDDSLDIYEENYYYIGTDYNGKKRTVGDLILTINSDSSYTLSGLINQSGYIEYIDRQDDPGMSITIDGKVYIVDVGTNYCYDEDGNEYIYDVLTLRYYEYIGSDIYDSCTYTFVGDGTPRVTVSFDDKSISLLIGSQLYLSNLPNVSKTGYEFGGWYSDEDCFISFDGIDELFEDVTIYPKWFNKNTDSYLTHAYGTFTINGAVPEYGQVYLSYGSETIAECDTYMDSNFSLDFYHAIAPGEYQISFVQYGDWPEMYSSTFMINITNENLGNFNINVLIGDYFIINEGFYPIAVDGFNEYRMEDGTESLTYEIKYGELFDTSDADIIAISNEMDTGVDNKQFFYINSYHYNMYYEEEQPVYNTGSHVLKYKLSYPTYKLYDLALYRTIPGSGTASLLTKLTDKPTSNYQDGTYYVGDDCIYFYSSKFATYGISSMNRIDYTMEEKPSEPINTDDNQDVVFRSNAPYSKFYDGVNIIGSVKVDRNIVDPSNYIHEEGSTKITLKASYLSTLVVGTHNLEIVSTDGSATSSFVITRNSTPTPTPDPGHNPSDNRYIVVNTGVK